MAPTRGVGRAQIALMAIAAGALAVRPELLDAKPSRVSSVGALNEAERYHILNQAPEISPKMAALARERDALSAKERELLDLVPERFANDEYIGPTVIRCFCGVHSMDGAHSHRHAAVKAIVRSGFRPLLGHLWCSRCFRKPERRARFAGAWAAKKEQSV